MVRPRRVLSRHELGRLVVAARGTPTNVLGSPFLKVSQTWVLNFPPALRDLTRRGGGVVDHPGHLG